MTSRKNSKRGGSRRKSSRNKIGPEDLDLLDDLAAIQAERSFWAFRQYLHPGLVKSWWLRDAAHHLQQFYDDMVAGKRPKLLLTAPPQHGKSFMVSDFASWVAGKNPDIKTIYASFSTRLGARANTANARNIDSRQFQRTFPGTRISKFGTNKDGHHRNTEIVEYIGRQGYFRNTTVRGAITGEGLDLGILDDPIKGRDEASSQLIRDKTWEWLTDDFLTRFSDGAGMLGIMTRWHIDDPFGRLQDHFPDVKVIKYPAIAERDEEHRKEGDPLFPEMKPLDFLLERKKLMAEPHWAALYQQSPVIEGGNIFHDEWWQFYSVLPELEWRFIIADTAQKKGQQNDYSVIQCWGKTAVGKRAVLIDQIRGKWESPELKTRAIAFWNKHNAETGAPLRSFKVEDAVSGTGLIQELRREGIPIHGIRRSRDKVMRAYDAAPFVEAGLVLLPRKAPWLSDFLLECSAFPVGAHDDQVDPMMDAVHEILAYRGETFAWNVGGKQIKGHAK